MSGNAFLGTIIPVGFLIIAIIISIHQHNCQLRGKTPFIGISASLVIIIGVPCFIWFSKASPQFVHELVWAFQKDDPKVVDAIVVETANCLDSEAKWIHGSRSQKYYDELKYWNKPSYVINSLVRQVIVPERRLHILFLTVKLGIPGSEEKLADVLMQYGDKKMAEDYLNSGSTKLSDAGKLWAKKNGYIINAGTGSHRVYWGQY